MELDRRSSRRSKVGLFCNQYIDGFPHLTEALELSMTGALVRRVLGPDVDRACYALELGDGGDSVWLCATPVWRQGPFEAVRFVAQSLSDKLRLADVLGAYGRC
ncbi:MAG: hypothetical protein HOW73_33610 [Polyangiaceae bacterium]|nr:hypothetical protein [Polyangiaceae bacterium]